MSGRRFFRVLVVAIAMVSTAIVGAGPAQAELVEPPSSEWGLVVDNGSATMGSWDALGYAVEYSSGLVITGGKFRDVTNGSTTITQPWLAAFDASTQEFQSWWTPTLDGTVLALEASSDGGLFVGGEFGDWEGSTIGALQKIDPTTGEVWPGWNSRVYGGTSVVRDIRLEHDGWLYVVGTFTTATDGNGPQAVTNAIRMNPVTGAIDWAWDPSPNGSVWGVSASHTSSEVYLAGWFTELNGDAGARGFAGVSPTGDILHDRSTIGYNTCVNCTQYYRLYDVVATAQGDVWVGGEQHALFVLDEATNLDMEYMHYTNYDTAHPTPGRWGGEYQEIELVGDRIYATCHCWGSHLSDSELIMHSSTPTGTWTGEISALAAYDVVTLERIQGFDPYMSGESGGFGIVGTPDGCVWLTGGINTFGVPGNQSSARDLVRFCDEAGAGTIPDPLPTGPAPLSCTATNPTGNQIELTFDQPEGATDIIVEREIDGDGDFNWRGKVAAPGTTFQETGVEGSLNSYRVKAKYPVGQFSAPVNCDPAINLAGPQPPPAPAVCSASAAGLAATVTWDAVGGATDYRVYRSVNGGNTYWRGVTQTTSFSESLNAGSSHHYSVQAKTNGVWSVSTDCTPDLVGDVPVSQPPAVCSASAAGLAATVTWDAVGGATDYRVYRSVNGGNTYWRGVTQTTSFSESLNAGSSHHYSVQAKTNGVWSVSTDCTPDLVGDVPVSQPPAVCSASAAGLAATVTWDAVGGATDYRVYRSVNGGNTYWRGVTQTTSFSESLNAGSSHHYSVQAKTNGVWSVSTDCTPDLVG